MKPIALNGSEVRAILDGRKTQMRRLARHRHGVHFLGGDGDQHDPECWGWSFDGPDHSGYMVLARGLNQRHDHGLVSMPCPYGSPGDRLWVRETWGMSYVDIVGDRSHVVGGHWGSPSRPNRQCAVVFRADADAMPPDPHSEVARWSPAIYMPSWASRITLLITDVRVQRLQEVSEEDARAEGVACGLVPPDEDGPARVGYVLGDDDGRCALHPTPRDAFAAGWDLINGKRATWASNPWVWALSFEVTNG